MCWVADCDPWKVYREHTRTARKSHTCEECGRTIAIGERYHWATGLHPDWPKWQTFHMCAHCYAAAQWLTVMCSGWCYGGVAEELREHWDEEWQLRSPGLGRLIIGIGNKWQHGKYRPGQRMDVPDWAAQCARDTLARNKVAA